MSARATATRRSSSTRCPAMERHCQIQRSENGRSGTSTAPPTRSVAWPAIATPLPEPSARQAPRLGSIRSGSMPMPAMANVASSFTSMPSRSSVKRRICIAAARSASETRRSSSPSTVMPFVLRWISSPSSRPRCMSSRRQPSSVLPSARSCGCPSSTMRTRDQSATGTSAGTGGSVFGRSNRPAT